MAHRILVTGGTGFVGTAVVDRLLTLGHTVRLFVHHTQSTHQGVESVTGNILDASAVKDAAQGCDWVVHLVGIIAEKPSAGVTFEQMHVQATRNVVDAAIAHGARRYVHMSALGTRPNAVSPYHRTKWQAEQYVQNHAPPWTISRPSMILGKGGAFLEQLRGWAEGKALPYFFMPFFGRGFVGHGTPATVQPVLVEDVAEAFAACLDEPKTLGRIYNVAGPAVYTWEQLFWFASQEITGKPKLAVPLPAWFAKLTASIAPAALLPFNMAQVQMAIEDNVGDTTELRQDLHWTPQPIVSAFH